MARIPYGPAGRQDNDILVSRIKTERGSLLDIYHMLLHSPPVAEGWLCLLTAVRQKSLLPGAMRELVIMRIASLNRAPYEAQQHRAHALAAGLSEAQIDALADELPSDGFSARSQAVLDYTDAMTRNIQVPAAVFANVRSYFSDRELVELTVTVAAYNMVSRFLEALEIRPEHIPNATGPEQLAGGEDGHHA